MPQIINTNIASLTAQRNLDRSQSANETALNRLSSGLRINSAKDDAAGLAISTRFESQTKGLAVAIRNAGDGISLAQTAEGALGSMTDSLQRIRELAVQSANATNSSSDREALQAEAAQLIDEINRVSEETNFNGQKLLNGDFAGAFQVGANTGERISFDLSSVTTSSLGVSEQAGVSAVGTDEALGNGDLNINGRDIRASSSQDDTLSYKNASASSLAKAAAINDSTDESGVKAVVDENVVGGSSMTAEDASGTLTINGVSINVETTSDATSTRSAVATAINAVSDETGVMAVDSETDELGVTLMAEDGRNITLDYSGTLTAQNTGLAETAAGSKAQVSAGNDSTYSGPALDFSNKEGASVTFGLDLTTATTDLNFSNADATDDAATNTATVLAAAQGATSFNVETDNGEYDVVLNKDYSGTAADSQDYLAMVEDINEQIDGSGFTAGVNADGKLEFTQDVAGQGYIKLSNGDEGYTGSATLASVEANNVGNGTLAAVAGGTITFDVVDSEGTATQVTIAGGGTSLGDLVTDINTELDSAAGDAKVSARINDDTGALEFFATTTGNSAAEDTGSNNFTVRNFENTTTNITDTQVNTAFGMNISQATGGDIISSSNDATAVSFGVSATQGENGAVAATTARVTGATSAGAFTFAATSQVTFDITDANGNTTNIDLDADADGANLAALVAEINNQLAAGAPGDTFVTAEVSGGALSLFASDTAGTGGTAITGANNFAIDNVTIATPLTSTQETTLNALFGFDIASLNNSAGTVSSADVDGMNALGATATVGVNAESADTAAFGNNDASSVFGEAVDQDGETLAVASIAATGRDDSFSFDVTTSGEAGANSKVNTIAIDESVSDLNSLVSAINNSLAEDSQATVSAFNNDGKLAFQTVGNYEGSISVGNFRDNNDQSEDVTGTQAISNSDIDALFGFSITSSSEVGGVGSGVKGSVDLNAPETAPLTLSENATGTASAISFNENSIVYDGGDVGLGTLNITLGNAEASIDASAITSAMSAAGDGDSVAAAINEALIGTELEGKVEARADGTTFTIQSTENNGEQLTLSAGSKSADSVDRAEDVTGVNALFSGITLADSALNDVDATATATGTAATTANNVLDVTVTDAAGNANTESITVAAGSYGDAESLATAINTAIEDNASLNGNVSAYVEDGGIALRQIDEAATSTVTLSGSGESAMFGTQAVIGASAGAIDSTSSTIEGDGDGKIGGEDTFEGGYTLLAVGVTSSIEIQGGNDTGNGSLDNSGLAAGTFEKGVASYTSADRAAAVDVTRGAGIAGSVDATSGVDVVASQTLGTTATLGGVASDFGANTDFSGNSGDDNVSFDLSYTDADGNSNTTTIALTTNIGDVNALIDDINDELVPSGLGVTAQVNSDGDGIEFVASSGVGEGTVSVGNVNTGYNGTASQVDGNTVNAILGMDAVSGTDSSSTTVAAAQVGAQELSSGTGYSFLAAANDVDIDITLDGGTTTTSITLDNTSGAANDGVIADLDALVTELNAQIAAADDQNFSAINDNGRLAFVETAEPGTGVVEGRGDTIAVTITANGTAQNDADFEALVGLGNLDTSAAISWTSAGGSATNDSISFAGGAPATVAGTNTIEANDTLSWSVDGGETGSVELAAGNYTTDEAVDAINNAISNASTADDSAFNLKGSTAFNEDGKVVIRSDNTANSGLISAIGGDAAAAFGLGATTATEVDKVSGVNTLDSGDLVLNNVQIGASKATYDTASYDGAATSDKRASGIAIAEAINRESDATGVTAKVNATQAVGGDGTTATNYGAGDTGAININGVEIGDITLSGDREADRRTAVSLINDKSGQTGVTAVDNGVSISLEAADGRNLSVAIDNKSAANSGSGDDKGTGFGAAIGLDASVDGIGEADFATDSKTADEVYETSYSTVTLESADVIDVKGGVNGNTAIQELGLEQGTFGGAEGGTFLKDVDLSTVDGANAAIEAIDNALGTVASIRADLGALQNRFESTTANLAITAENLTAANSRIRDADFAAETAELSRTQVLQQAGISILAQANQRPQQVLSLLG